MEFIRKKIQSQPITSEKFKPYGQVIAAEGEYSLTNQNTGKKWNNLVDLDMFYNNGIINLGILKTKNIELTFDFMERHIFTSQIFIPLDGKRSLVAVAPENDEGPEPDLVEVFSLKGNQGVSFNRKVWHHTLFPLDGETEYILMMRGGFKGKDVEIVRFKNNIEFEIEI